jgi:hypothetical protein
MREFSILDITESNDETGVIQIKTQGAAVGAPRLSMRREGGYVSIAVTAGPVEVALRPRFPDLTRVLGRLRPVAALVVRPTIVADATGHLCFNLLVTSEAREALFTWLDVIPDQED